MATRGWGAALIAAQPPIVAATEADVITIFALATPAARRLGGFEIAMYKTPADRALATRNIAKQRWLSYAEAALRSNTLLTQVAGLRSLVCFVWLKNSVQS